MAVPIPGTLAMDGSLVHHRHDARSNVHLHLGIFFFFFLSGGKKLCVYISPPQVNYFYIEYKMCIHTGNVVLMGNEKIISIKENV